MKVLGLIPARGGSKSIVNKNLVDLGGCPLIKWTIDTAIKSKLNRVIVSTDNGEIANVCRNFGAEVPFDRPKDLASDDAQSIDVVLHALDVLDEQFDAVMLLQPTSPFRKSEDIDLALTMIGAGSSVISVVQVDGTHPARMKFIEDGFLVDPPFVEEVENMPRQKLRPMYIRNGAIYLTGVNDLKNRTFKGAKSRALVMPRERSLNIDSEFDLFIARAMLDGGLI
ncbi:acylneuraminate cytidylyltransferase family protein [bacterium]|nr:acylneuraminate cytidylyltransferase family protein [bacterium]